jgi:hypothetical protein
VFSYSSRPRSGRMPRWAPRPSLPLCLTSVLAGLTVIALPAASAQAAPASTTCPTPALSQPFLKWGDSSSYELVTGGSFEGSLAGWTLSSGASQVAGSESFGVTGAVGSSSLGLAAGASAQSPFTCVDASYKTFRFFARNSGAASRVLVQVVYETPIGLVSVPVGTVTLTNGWQPTPAMPTGAQLAGNLLGGTAQMALTFTAVTGTSAIDDVFVDPRMR